METKTDKPWWTDDTQAVATIPPTPDSLQGTKDFGKSLGNDVIEAVPQLKMVDLEHLISEYGMKDGLLNYHFYAPTRYAIRIDAEAQMEKIRQDTQTDRKWKDQQQNSVATSANRALEQTPWPEKMVEIISHSFKAVFPYTDFKLSYFQEVDSWSLVAPIPSKGIVTPKRMEEVIHLVNDSLQAG